MPQVATSLYLRTTGWDAACEAAHCGEFGLATSVHDGVAQ